MGAAGSGEGGRDGGKPEAPERGRSGRADEGSGLCRWVSGASLDPMGASVAEMMVDQSLDCRNLRQFFVVEQTGYLNSN